ncbi:MAG: PAS domain-containing protein, partial [Bacillota bacterium]
MRGHLRRQVFLQCLIYLLATIGMLGIIEYLLVLENRPWVFLGVGIASAVFVAWYFTVRVEQELLEPIRDMTRMTRQLIGKQMKYTLPDEYVDELALLGKTLSEVGSRIQRNISELTEEKNKIQAIIECMAEGVISLDQRGRVALLNPAAAAMFRLQGTE